MSSGPASIRRGRPALGPAALSAGRAKIAADAETLFREEGYAAVSMRRLAKKTGCAPMTLYAYFDSKQDILRSIWSGFFAELFDKLTLEGALISDPEARLKAISTGFVRYWVAHPERYRMVFMSEGVSQSDVGDFVGLGEIQGRYALFAETLLAARPATAKVKLLSEALVCGLQGVAHSHVTISAHGWEPPETLAAAIVDAILLEAAPAT